MLNREWVMENKGVAALMLLQQDLQALAMGISDFLAKLEKSDCLDTFWANERLGAAESLLAYSETLDQTIDAVSSESLPGEAPQHKWSANELETFINEAVSNLEGEFAPKEWVREVVHIILEDNEYATRNTVRQIIDNSGYITQAEARTLFKQVLDENDLTTLINLEQQVKIAVSQQNLVNAARAKEIAKKLIQEYNTAINEGKTMRRDYPKSGIFSAAEKATPYNPSDIANEK